MDAFASSSSSALQPPPRRLAQDSFRSSRHLPLWLSPRHPNAVHMPRLRVAASRQPSIPAVTCDDGVAAFLARKSTFDRIQSCGVIACLRSDNEEVALNAGRAALDGGVSVLEVTMRTPGVYQVIKKLVNEYPSATIGAGTVLTWRDAENAKEAGAMFLMSPVTNKELVQAHNNSKIIFIPGAMTPFEILQGRKWGASCVKLYPVSLMGGVQCVEMLKRLFPNIPIIPSSGISLDMVESYQQVGSTAVILSDAIFNKAALAYHDYAQITQQSKGAVVLAAELERVDTSTLRYTKWPKV